MDDYSGKTISEIKRLLDATGLGNRREIIQRLDKDPRTGVQKLVNSYRTAITKVEIEENVHDELTRYERKLYGQGFNMVAGVDEAGRGALAGPLVAASVILPKAIKMNGLRDSKQLSPKQREFLYEKIVDKAIAWNVALIEHHEIDSHGLQQANIRALELAVSGLNPAADYVLTDAFAIKTIDLPCLAIIKGDSLSLSIAAASVLAKVTRDRIMCEYHETYPQYGFAQHKGYGTLIHMRALEKHGPSPIHRKCFAPVGKSEVWKS